jgi:NAD(P)-dependent dehydrogenase (short-subunit alcohol dehydrogenase family)
MTNESKPLVLVTGGTGKQGGAAVAALLAANKTRVRVLTRDPKSPKAQGLAQLGVELASGDLDDPAAVQVALQGVSAAFSVQAIEGKGGVEAEERQGVAFAEAVKAAGGVHLSIPRSTGPTGRATCRISRANGASSSISPGSASRPRPCARSLSWRISLHQVFRWRCSSG